MKKWTCVFCLLAVGCGKEIKSSPHKTVQKLGRIQVLQLVGHDKFGEPQWESFETDEVAHEGDRDIFRDINTKMTYRLRATRVIERYPLEVEFKPTDPRDKEILKKNQGAVMNNTILPSGIPIPPRFESSERDWIVRGDIIHLESVKEVQQ